MIFNVRHIFIKDSNTKSKQSPIHVFPFINIFSWCFGTRRIVKKAIEWQLVEIINCSIYSVTECVLTYFQMCMENINNNSAILKWIEA